MFLENDLTKVKLKQEIISIIKNKEKSKKMSKNSFSIGDENSLLKLSRVVS